MIYFFYIKNDKNKEPINKGNFKDIFEAKEHFSKIKNLSQEQFSKIYSVDTIEDDRTRKEKYN
jgi:hypothetical protein